MSKKLIMVESRIDMLLKRKEELISMDKRKNDTVSYEPNTKRLKIVSNRVKPITKLQNDILLKNTIVCGFSSLPNSCGSIIVRLTVTQKDGLRWISKIQHRLFNSFEVWMAYNFDLFDLFVDDVRKSDLVTSNNVEFVEISTISRIPTNEDLPFWHIVNGNLIFTEKLKEDSISPVHFMRDLKTTKKTPIQLLICYLATEVSLGILESLFWNNVGFKYEFPVESIQVLERGVSFLSLAAEEKLIWNMYSTIPK